MLLPDQYECFPLFPDEPILIPCIYRGLKYKPGTIWRKRCEELSCTENGTMFVREITCREVCVLSQYETKPCCPVCRKKITCTSREMKIVIPRRMLGGHDVMKLTLGNVKCKPKITGTHVIFKSRLGRCGMKRRKWGNGFIYTNTVQKSYFNNFIIRPLFRFSCVYKVKDFDVDSRSAGMFKAKPPKLIRIHMAYTDNEGNILEENPTQKEALEGKPVFVQIKTNGNLREDQYLVVETCEILSLNRRKKYVLLHKG